MTSIRAPITGRVWKIERRPGDRVSDGETVIILESMKMEVPIESPAAGVIASVEVSEGEAVEEGAVVATLE
ncbi:MAG TPA: acetyl-CoA carboxylase biotin carboxyl carrier protein subunit [Kofleriaceae bacterium]|nr:acetyl-CoA carboxylase biotin carboxyl carrier protein subunit [Kofleriaceae bacterium]